MIWFCLSNNSQTQRFFGQNDLYVILVLGLLIPFNQYFYIRDDWWLKSVLKVATIIFLPSSSQMDRYGEQSPVHCHIYGSVSTSHSR